jgi:uncharacterized protein YecT (DUF1311 family)
MSTVRFVVCLWLATMGFLAAAHAQASFKPEAAPTAQEVLSALSGRSKLPEEDLRRLTADCTADQQSMYFCAYRDLVSAELKLQRVVAEKERRLPACKPDIDARVAHWRAARDQACIQSAAKEWAGGSMEPTARNICLSDSTGRMLKQMQRMSVCPRQ